MGSILTTTKKALGLDEEYTVYDSELIMFINAALSNLTQLGVGPKLGYAIADKEQLWADFMGEDARLNNAQMVVYLSVKLVFDTTATETVLGAFERMRDEAIWRLNVQREEIDHPQSTEDPEVTVPVELVIDGGAP